MTQYDLKLEKLLKKTLFNTREWSLNLQKNTCSEKTGIKLVIAIFAFNARLKKNIPFREKSFLILGFLRLKFFSLVVEAYKQQ